MENEEIVSDIVGNNNEEVQTEDLGELTLEDLLTDLIPETIESIPDGPVFPDSQEKEDTIQEEDLLSEEDFDELESEIASIIDEEVAEKEAAIAEKEVAIAKSEELSSQIDQINLQLSEEQKNNEEISAALKSIVDHPSIGKYALDILSGKEVSLPKLLEEKVNENISAMGDISAKEPVAEVVKQKSLGDVLSGIKQPYNPSTFVYSK